MKIFNQTSMARKGEDVPGGFEDCLTSPESSLRARSSAETGRNILPLPFRLKLNYASF